MDECLTQVPQNNGTRRQWTNRHEEMGESDQFSKCCFEIKMLDSG